MVDFCFIIDGNIFVVDGDEDGKSRIQMFDYEGNKFLQIILEVEVLNIVFCFNSIVIDFDGKIIVGDIVVMCVFVFFIDGKIVCKFGKLG